MAWAASAPNHVPIKTRKRISQRDAGVCQHCGGVGAEVDHINNTRGVGYDDDDNLQLLCVRCHQRKTQQEAQRAKAIKQAKLKRAPLPSFGLM